MFLLQNLLGAYKSPARTVSPRAAPPVCRRLGNRESRDPSNTTPKNAYSVSLWQDEQHVRNTPRTPPNLVRHSPHTTRSLRKQGGSAVQSCDAYPSKYPLPPLYTFPPHGTSHNQNSLATYQSSANVRRDDAKQHISASSQKTKAPQKMDGLNTAAWSVLKPFADAFNLSSVPCSLKSPKSASPRDSVTETTSANRVTGEKQSEHQTKMIARSYSQCKTGSIESHKCIHTVNEPEYLRDAHVASVSVEKSQLPFNVYTERQKHNSSIRRNKAYGPQTKTRPTIYCRSSKRPPGDALQATVDRMSTNGSPSVTEDANNTDSPGRLHNSLTPLKFRDLGTLTVQYFDTGRFLGRGGKIRLFLRMKHVQHVYEAFNLESLDLIRERQRQLIQSGHSPTGHLPVLIHNDRTFCETHAILRYLAKLLGEYGSRPDKEDYFADLLMEKIAYWTDDLMCAVKEVLNMQCKDGVVLYLQRRLGYFSLIDVLLGKIRSAWLTPPKHSTKRMSTSPGSHEWIPTWYDAAVASTLFDDMQLIRVLQETQQLLPMMHHCVQWYALPYCPSNAAVHHNGIYHTLLLDSQGANIAMQRFPMLFAYYKDVINDPLVHEMLSATEWWRNQHHHPYKSPLNSYPCTSHVPHTHQSSNPQCFTQCPQAHYKEEQYPFLRTYTLPNSGLHLSTKTVANSANHNITHQHQLLKGYSHPEDSERRIVERRSLSFVIDSNSKTHDQCVTTPSCALHVDPATTKTIRTSQRSCQIPTSTASTTIASNLTTHSDAESLSHMVQCNPNGPSKPTPSLLKSIAKVKCRGGSTSNSLLGDPAEMLILTSTEDDMLSSPSDLTHDSFRVRATSHDVLVGTKQTTPPHAIGRKNCTTHQTLSTP